jgi:CRP/FNR family cyclic AMP-dependent transcriptional regulator
METHSTIILTSLLSLVDKLKSLSSLFPPEASTELIIASVQSLREKLGMRLIPEEIQKSFAASLDRLLKEREEIDRKVKDEIQSTYFELDVEKEMMLKVPSVKKNAHPGENIFNEGENGTEAYIVTKGEVEIFRKLGNRKIILATLGPRAIVGDMSLIDNQPRMGSAKALKRTELVIISQESLTVCLERLGQNDQVLRQIMGVLVKRARGQARSAE